MTTTATATNPTNPPERDWLFTHIVQELGAEVTVIAAIKHEGRALTFTVPLPRGLVRRLAPTTRALRASRLIGRTCALLVVEALEEEDDLLDEPDGFRITGTITGTPVKLFCEPTSDSTCIIRPRIVASVTEGMDV